MTNENLNRLWDLAAAFPPEDELEILRDDQWKLALRMRDAVASAREAGLTWDRIGNALGMRRETVFRQFQSGGPIDTVRVTHKPKED